MQQRRAYEQQRQHRQAQRQAQREARRDAQAKEALLWDEAVDAASGDTYYYHTITDEVTWDKPRGYVPPAQREQQQQPVASETTAKGSKAQKQPSSPLAAMSEHEVQTEQLLLKSAAGTSDTAAIRTQIAEVQRELKEQLLVPAGRKEQQRIEAAQSLQKNETGAAPVQQQLEDGGAGKSALAQQQAKVNSQMARLAARRAAKAESGRIKAALKKQGYRYGTPAYVKALEEMKMHVEQEKEIVVEKKQVQKEEQDLHSSTAELLLTMIKSDKGTCRADAGNQSNGEDTLTGDSDDYNATAAAARRSALLARISDAIKQYHRNQSHRESVLLSAPNSDSHAAKSAAAKPQQVKRRARRADLLVRIARLTDMVVPDGHVCGLP
jgi:hypothetical protein